MGTEYREDELEKLLISHLATQGFHVEIERIIDERIPWRPDVFAKRDDSEFAIDIRLSDKITDFWLTTYKKACEICPRLKVFVAIPEDIVIPFTLGRRLEENNIGIILVSFDSLNFLLEPRSPAEREATRAIRRILDARIDMASCADLEPYVKEITDAVNIFEIGCPRESIGAIGRVLETSIDDFLIEANRKRRIALSEARRKSMDFHNKIGFLASPRYPGGRRKPLVITPSEQSKMLSVKWDRNIGDHPADDAEIQQLIKDSRAILELGINMIRLMKTKKEEL
jgi:hypothetical protein